MHIVLIYIKNNLHINWFTTKMSVNMGKIHFFKTKHLLQKLYTFVFCFVCLMVFDFNTITVICLRSVLIVEEIGILGENQRPVASH